MKPRLSVIVVILAGREYLVRCLDALAEQTLTPAEIIVPHDDQLENVAELRARFPSVRFEHRPGNRTYAQLRAAGFHEAVGEIVALTEDHCSPDPDWCATIVELHDSDFAAVGGSVDKSGHDTALNWATYLSDFGRYMNPVKDGPAGYLTDCNVSYKRASLNATAALWQDEFHETTVNWALQEAGKQLLLSPRVIVRQQRSLTLGYALRERFEFGRLFASTRVAAAGPQARLTYTAASALLPAVLIGRVLKNVLQKRRAIGQCARAFPALLLINIVWSAGEFVGYITGKAGSVVKDPAIEPAAVVR
jgi:glycosyltransferase involved in cell wall biosynthesis